MRLIGPSSESPTGNNVGLFGARALVSLVARLSDFAVLNDSFGT